MNIAELLATPLSGGKPMPGKGDTATTDGDNIGFFLEFVATDTAIVLPDAALKPAGELAGFTLTAEPASEPVVAGTPVALFQDAEVERLQGQRGVDVASTMGTPSDTAQPIASQQMLNTAQPEFAPKQPVQAFASGAFSKKHIPAEASVVADTTVTKGGQVTQADSPAPIQAIATEVPAGLATQPTGLVVQEKSSTPFVLGPNVASGQLHADPPREGPHPGRLNLQPSTENTARTTTQTQQVAIAPADKNFAPNPDMKPEEFVGEHAMRSDPVGDVRLNASHAATQIATVQVSSPQKAVLHQVVAALSKPQEGTIQIRLDPPELGRITLHISATDYGNVATISADRPEVLDLIRRNESQLGAELASAGYQNLKLDFAQNGETDNSRDDRASAASQFVAAEPLQQPVTAADQIRAVRQSGATALDIRL